MPASASVSSQAGHSLKAALGTITFLCHRFVQYLYLLYYRIPHLSMQIFVTIVFQFFAGREKALRRGQTKCRHIRSAPLIE